MTDGLRCTPRVQKAFEGRGMAVQSTLAPMDEVTSKMVGTRGSGASDESARSILPKPTALRPLLQSDLQRLHGEYFTTMIDTSWTLHEQS